MRKLKKKYLKDKVFKRITKNIAHAMLQCTDDERNEYLNEEFYVAWLESTDEWVVVFGDNVLYDGFSSEKEAQGMYDLLEDRSYELFYELQAK